MFSFVTHYIENCFVQKQEYCECKIYLLYLPFTFHLHIIQSTILFNTSF